MGERIDFEAFCRAEYERVLRTTYWVAGDLAEARDLTQEAFARAFATWRKVSALERPEAWVRRVAVNLALSHQRRQRLVRRPRPRIVEESSPEPAAPDPALRRALLELTPAQRAVIVLRFYADRSVAEVARDLGKRPGTVRALTSQGLTRLRARVEREGADHEARG